MSLNNIFQRTAKWQIVLGCGVLTVAFVLFFVSADLKAPAGTPGIIQLELAFTEGNFSSIINQWSEAGTLQVQERNLWIDLLFPVAYAVFLSSLLAFLTVRPDGEPSPGLMLLLIQPFIAGLLDWVENISLLLLLRDTSNLSESLIFLASTVASFKWILILVSALAIIYHILRKVVALAR